MSKNYTVKNVGALEKLADKVFIKDDMGLTSMEASINRQPAGTGVPFVHYHKQNEELYIVTSGNGVFFIDGEEFPVEAGSIVSVKPAAERSLKAGSEDLCYICVQAAENSLQQYVMTDAGLTETKTSWIM